MRVDQQVIRLRIQPHHGRRHRHPARLVNVHAVDRLRIHFFNRNRDRPRPHHHLQPLTILRQQLFRIPQAPESAYPPAKSPPPPPPAQKAPRAPPHPRRRSSSAPCARASFSYLFPQASDRSIRIFRVAAETSSSGSFLRPRFGISSLSTCTVPIARVYRSQHRGHPWKSRTQTHQRPSRIRPGRHCFF